MPVLRKESSIQTAVVKWARNDGFIAIKLSPLGAVGTSGWPDYMFLRFGKIVFIEFKREGGKLTELQAHRQAQLRAARFEVHTIDNVEAGKALLKEFR